MIIETFHVFQTNIYKHRLEDYHLSPLVQSCHIMNFALKDMLHGHQEFCNTMPLFLLMFANVIYLLPACIKPNS